MFAEKKLFEFDEMEIKAVAPCDRALYQSLHTLVWTDRQVGNSSFT